MLKDVQCRCTCAGATVWVTGRSLADRRAAAYAMAERLAAEGRRVQVLDRFDGSGARSERTGMTAAVLARNGIVAIVPCATEGAVTVRARHEASGIRYVEMSVTGKDAPQESAAMLKKLFTARR